MIAVTRMDKKLMYINPDHIISIEETPDTVITLFNGNRFILKDSADTIINRLISFRAKIVRRALTVAKKKIPANRLTRKRNWAIKLHSEEVSGYLDTKNHTPFHSRDF